MSEDTITLALSGEVRLGEFAVAMRRLEALVEALASETSDPSRVVWVVEDLHAGSAMATFRGISDEADLVDCIVRKYAVVGKKLERNEPVPFSPPVVRRATELCQILNERVRSMRFETAREEATVLHLIQPGEAGPRIEYSMGVIQGTVQTLTNRGRLRFTLYDALFDRAVSCYLSEEHREGMRNVWGRRAAVAGRVGRDRESGHPVIVRDVTAIEVARDVEPGAYKRARGILRTRWTGENSEDIIRRVRDA